MNCLCGCGEDISHKRPGSKYFDDSHRAKYHKNSRLIGQGRLQEVLGFAVSNDTNPVAMIEQTKKREGMELAANNHAEILDKFRAIAHGLTVQGYSGRSITIDDVREYADRTGIQYTPSNWLGSVFKGWKWTGEVKASTHEGSHGRMVKVWTRRAGI